MQSRQSIADWAPKPSSQPKSTTSRLPGVGFAPGAASYGFYPRRIAVSGASAGGYLATMLGVTSEVQELEDLSLGHAEQSSDVQCVVDCYGPTDFLKLDDRLNESGLTPRSGMEHNAPR